MKSRSLRGVGLLLCLCLALSALAAPAFGDGWLDNADEDWQAHGSGTEDDPWLISTPEQLAGLAKTVYDANSGDQLKGKHVALTADIDLQDIEWTPIGRFMSNWSNCGFAGTFDGRGHRVTGLYVSQIRNTGTKMSECPALFGYLASAGTIKDLYVEGLIEDNVSQGGAILVTWNCGTISNCVVSGDATATGHQRGYSGGIAAVANGGTITNCVVYGGYHSFGTSNNMNYAGNFVGYASQSATSKLYNSVGLAHTVEANGFQLTGARGLTNGMIDCTSDACWWLGGTLIENGQPREDHRGTATKGDMINDERDAPVVAVLLDPASMKASRATWEYSSLFVQPWPLRAASTDCSPEDIECEWTFDDPDVVVGTTSGPEAVILPKTTGEKTFTVKVVGGVKGVGVDAPIVLKGSVTIVAGTEPISSMALSDTTLALDVTDTHTLSATIQPDDALQGVVWASSQPGVATVDKSSGLVTAIAPGTTTITATSEGKGTDMEHVTRTCDVTVSWKPATDITFSERSVTVSVGGTSAIVSADVSPQGADPDVRLEVVDPSVATIDPTGTGTFTVTGKALGDTKVKATSGSVIRYLDVEVRPLPIVSIVPAVPHLSLAVGATHKLVVEVEPIGADAGMDWGVDDPTVVSVDPSGLVTALGEGTATIIGMSQGTTATGDRITVSIKVSVGSTAPELVTGVSLDKARLALDVGGTATLVATVAPASADQTVSWSTSDASVATVDEDGTVRAISDGAAIVTVTTKAKDAEGESMTASCLVTVGLALPADPTKPASLTLSETNMSLAIGEKKIIGHTIAPETAVNKEVAWQSDTPSVAVVHYRTGEVTGRSEGIAIITATTDDGGLKASCVVVVKGRADDDGDIAPPAAPDTTRARTTPARDGRTIVITITTMDGRLLAGGIRFHVWLIPVAQGSAMAAPSGAYGPFEATTASDGSLELDAKDLIYAAGPKKGQRETSLPSGRYAVKFADAETGTTHVGTTEPVSLQTSHGGGEKGDGGSGCDAGIPGAWLAALALIAGVRMRKEDR